MKSSIWCFLQSLVQWNGEVLHMAGRKSWVALRTPQLQHVFHSMKEWIEIHLWEAPSCKPNSPITGSTNVSFSHPFEDFQPSRQSSFTPFHNSSILARSWLMNRCVLAGKRAHWWFIYPNVFILALETLQIREGLESRKKIYTPGKVWIWQPKSKWCASWV